MFSDIEDTFTTEAEAADAAPVQSVFGRVGDVVAETGDYAATQISNFSSEVLTSISGSTIAPSEITNLWNGAVVTADVNNTNTTTETLEAGTIANDRHYAGAFDAPDADARLDAALSFASTGDVIYLEASQYSQNRSINKSVNLIGTGVQASEGTTITGEWAFETFGINLMRFRGFDGEVVILNSACQVSQSAGANITDENGESIISHIRVGDIILQSGTDRTVVDTCVNTNVTDNGNNVIGDIS